MGALGQGRDAIMLFAADGAFNFIVEYTYPLVRQSLGTQHQADHRASAGRSTVSVSAAKHGGDNSLLKVALTMHKTHDHE